MPAKRKASAKAPVSRAKVAKKAADTAESPTSAPLDGKKCVTIEASKECGCFKARSGKLEKIITDARTDVVVKINEQKPRKGCFEVTVDGTVVLSLQEMSRPFTALKALDMEEEGKKILAALA
eukprot:GGOE01060890.1.p1 GENE.GGOE01060890.1~~GGOE01060890.1.p1  ORF type:complete len:123 (-),score=39.70 GGOE01060890.1:315-683(-)